MSIIQGNSKSAAGGFDPELIGNSVWLDGSADYLSKTFSSGSAETRLVFAAWVQRNTFTSTDQAIFSGLKNIGGTNLINRFVWHASDDMIEIHIEDVNSATIAYKTSRVFKDIGWYNLILSIDSNETDSVQLYINGVRETTLALTSGSALSAAPAAWGNAALHNIGAYYNGASNFHFLNNYVAQPTMLVGKSIQAGDYAITDFLDSFAFSSGSQFGPKADADITALASSAGGNSFCLNFEDGSDLGNDSSSNNNDFTATSMSAANQSTNTPSLSYAVLNVLDKGSSATTSEGATRQPTGTDHVILSSMQIPTTGKWAISGRVDAGDFSFGICTQAHTRTSKIGRTNNSWGAIDAPGASFFRSEHDSVGSNSTSAVSAANDTFIIAFDADSGKLWLGRNDGGAGIAYLGGGNPATGATPTYTLSASEMSPGLHFAVGRRLTVSFGQRTHFETLPTDFLELNSANLPTPDAQGVDHFAVTLAQEGSLFSAMNTAEAAYSATLRIYKSRASASASETWGYSFSHDSSNEYILPAANTAMTYGSLRSLSGTDNWVGYSLNISSTAGTAAGSQAHSNGSDTTVTHSLGSSRYIVLLFSRSGGDIFYYHPDVAAGSLLKLNSNVLPFSSTVITDITTNSFDIGSAAASATYDYLVLAETPGVIDIFSYKGNGSTDGPYLSLNAMPEFLTFKLTTTHATEHIVLDQTRSPINDADIPYIMPNQLSAETNNTTFLTDFLSGAAKIRNSSTDGNFSGGTFVGWSFGKIASGEGLCPIYGR